VTHARVHDALKALPVRLPLDHELAQGLLGIPADQLLAPEKSGQIGAQPIQMPAEEILVSGSGDHQHAIAALKSLPKIAADIFGKGCFVSNVKLYEMASGVRLFE
jgi:hypothetical protein